MKSIQGTLFILAITLMTACVPAKKFEELQVNYDNLKSDFDELKTLKEFGDKSLDELKGKYNSLLENYDKSVVEVNKLRADYDKAQSSYEILSKNYKSLMSDNESEQRSLGEKLAKLSTELDVKKRELFSKESTLVAKENETNKLKENLDALEVSLREREKTVNELQAKLAAQEKAVSDLKDKLTSSLVGYKNSGITVVEKDGKIYVSLDNSLLFQSGKTDIDWKGKTALLKVAESLKDIEDFDIVVEGHTDDIPMKSATIQDNWDLSVLRATSVVRYLTTEGKMDPIKIIPSGRSKYVPVKDEKSSEARALNRRIEIILTPKLDQLMEIVK